GIIEIGTFPQSQAWDKGTYYMSSRKKLLRERAQLYAYACLSCGHVEIFIDHQHLSKSIKK
ncbi:MAG: hypothetical protein JSV49_09625, partial [Thermoplasmata archaeon]